MSSSSRRRLVGLQNVRDVAAATSVTPGVLYRSDAPAPGDEPPEVSRWPPSLVVDLRSGGETCSGDHPLTGPETTVLSRAMLAANPIKLVEDAQREAVSLEQLYVDLAATAAPIVAELTGLLACGHGPVLVHCAAGKDRTGVAIGTLLYALGIERDEVIADYVLTEQNLDGIVTRLIQAARPEDGDALRHLYTVEYAHLLAAPAEAINSALAVVDGTSGGRLGWLRAAGVDDATVSAARRRLAGG